MDKAGLVNALETVEQGEKDLMQCGFVYGPAFAEHSFQVRPLLVRHNQVTRVVVLEQGVNGDDVRMLEFG